MTRFLLAKRRSLPRIIPWVPTNDWKSRLVSSLVADPALVDAMAAPQDFSPECAVVYRDFLTPNEGDVLVQHVLKRLSRYVYLVKIQWSHARLVQVIS